MSHFLGRYAPIKNDPKTWPLYDGHNMKAVKAWSFSSSQYVQEAVNNVLKHLTARGIPSKAPGAAIKNDYRPKVDQTDELSPTDAAYY
jgi:hypothetical protein